MIDLISVVFVFLNFFVILGVIIFAVRRRLVPAAEKMLREQGVFFYNLESDYKDLQLQNQSIYENIQDQDRKFQALQARFVMWQKNCDKRVVLEQQDQLKIDEAMQQRFAMRAQMIEQHAVIKQQLPVIVAAATKSLQSKYQNVDEQKEYIEKLIGVMKERS